MDGGALADQEPFTAWLRRGIGRGERSKVAYSVFLLLYRNCKPRGECYNDRIPTV